jgi:Flp pilus assembly protein TadD
MFDEDQLKTRLAKNPRDAGAANGLGLALLQKGRPGEAERVLRVAQAAKPSDPVVSQNLAAALMAQKKDAAAVPLLRKSHAGFQSKAKAELQQAQLAMRKRDFKTAEGRIRDALRSQTLTADASARLGTALQRQGRTAEAATALRQAAETYLGVSRLRAQLGEVYSRRGNKKMAIYEFKVAARLDPRSGRPWYLLGNEAVALKRRAQAKRYYQTALAKEPNAPWARDARAVLGQAGGQPRAGRRRTGRGR